LRRRLYREDAKAQRIAKQSFSKIQQRMFSKERRWDTEPDESDGRTRKIREVPSDPCSSVSHTALGSAFCVTGNLNAGRSLRTGSSGHCRQRSGVWKDSPRPRGYRPGALLATLSTCNKFGLLRSNFQASSEPT